jgi:hypothetical protein
MAQAYKCIQIQHLYFVVDIDIKGFFDNVSHGKLLKQMWAMGIRDKKLLSIISCMLKAEVVGIGFPEKGTPQGGLCRARHTPPYVEIDVLAQPLLQQEQAMLPERLKGHGLLHPSRLKQ